MNIFVTADLHLGHKNIIKHCNRPFSNIQEMDETLISNWNRIVLPKDIVYIVGDFAWKTPDNYLKQLNGKKILIKGNHDYRFKKYYYLFEETHDILVRKINKQKIVFCHYKMFSWPGKNNSSWHLYGHSHGTSNQLKALCFDVGVDVWNFTPISWDRVVQKISELAKEFEYELSIK